jgi:hypothetical protein
VSILLTSRAHSCLINMSKRPSLYFSSHGAWGWVVRGGFRNTQILLSYSTSFSSFLTCLTRDFNDTLLNLRQPVKGLLLLSYNTRIRYYRHLRRAFCTPSLEFCCYLLTRRSPVYTPTWFRFRTSHVYLHGGNLRRSLLNWYVLGSVRIRRKQMVANNFWHMTISVWPLASYSVRPR